MPGIVGIVTKKPVQWAEPLLRRMLASITHDSARSTGVLLDESTGVYVGWAERKNSFADGMPVKNETGDITLVFSGEEFPDPGIIQQLKMRRHQVPPDGASYLAHIQEEDGSFPACLNGHFHGVLFDRHRGTVTLFNDRFGMHRLYYHESRDALFFAVEAKAILAVIPELRSLDLRGLGEFVSCGCVLENRSIFSGIQVLPPASTWTIRQGAVEAKGLYFQPKEWESQEALAPGDYYHQLRDVFSRNLPRYFGGKERVGLSLTGGLDTRMIMAWWKVPPGSVPCYTFRGMYNDCQDAIIARRVAKVCQQPHCEIPVGQEFLARFPQYAERTIFLSDACVDVSRSPVLYGNERAAEIAPVRMTGNYGSEILRRMVAFKPATPPLGLFSQELAPYFRQAKETYSALLQTHPASFIAFRQVPWHHWGLHSLEQTQLSPRSPYLDNELIQTIYRAPDTSLVNRSITFNNDHCLQLIADGNPRLREIRGDRGAGSPRTPRGALTRAYLEVTFKAEYEYDYGMPQWLAGIDHRLSWLHLERHILGRHKYYHFRVWYRDALAKYVQDILLDRQSLSRPHVERKTLETIVNDHVRGRRNHTLEIHKLLTLELIHRIFLENR